MVKEKIKLYGYQEESTSFVLSNIDKKHVLLAAAPNAGKTFMASFIIKKLIMNGSRILCSVHGTNILKRQFYDSVCNILGIENVSIYDTSDLSLYNPNKPVQVMIYQNTLQMKECVDKYGKFDYLVVDEAHKFYSTDSMMEISKDYVSGNHLLLTGSPATFKKDISDGFMVGKYISASLIESVKSGQYDKDIVLDIVSNDVHLTIDDYSSDGEVTKKSQRKLTNNKAVLESVLINDFGKYIIYVKGITQAGEIKTHLKSKGITTLTSNSETDSDSTNITLFKNNYSGVDNVVLIVVGRATEGFDDPNVSILDMTYTKNLDALYQRYSRAIRNRTDAKFKKYVKVVPNNGNSADVYVHIMTAVLMLLKQEHYENFNGRNFSIPTFKPDVIKKPKKGVGSVKSYTIKKKHVTKDIKDNTIIIKSKNKPVSVEELVGNKDFNVTVKVDGKDYEITTDDYNDWTTKLDGKKYEVNIQKSNDKVDDCLLMETSLYSGSFFDTKDDLYGLITRYATNKLSDVLRQVGNDYATEEEHIQFIKENNITSSHKYSELYKSSKLNLHSSPWRETMYGNGSEKDYFESIWGGYDTDEEHINFIKENEIINSEKYNKQYKKSKLNLYSHPWGKYGNGSAKDYFESIWGEYVTNEETFKICIANELTSMGKYSDYRNKNKDLNLISSPWQKTNESQSEFFKRVKEALCINDEFISPEEIFKICVDNKLTSNSKTGDNSYFKYRKNNPELNLSSNPYKRHEKTNTEKEYFELVKESLGINLLSPEETFKICVDNRLTSEPKYKKYKHKSNYKNLSPNPWKKNNESSANYFNRVKDKLGLTLISPEETFKICIDNNLIDGSKYKKYRIGNKNLNLRSHPWDVNKQSISRYFSLVKDYIKNNPKKTRDYKPAYLGEFSEMNKKWNTSNSKTTHDRLKEDKSEWVKYHKLYSDSRKKWDSIPYKEIAKIINNRPEWLVGDFGCGENLLKNEITNKVLSFDHISIDDSVTSCDLTNIPLEDSKLDVVVFSLSLMGTNYKEYFKEAYRTLKPMGMVIISEPSNRWKDNEGKLKELLEESGFNISGDIKHKDRFIYVTAIKL